MLVQVMMINQRGEFIADDKILSPDREASKRILHDQIREILNDLI
jgi:DNA-directed RNA polymerase sigma subunit (sigma70/sigma32)